MNPQTHKSHGWSKDWSKDFDTMGTSKSPLPYAKQSLLSLNNNVLQQKKFATSTPKQNQ